MIFRRESFFGGKRLGIASDQGKRRADVMGHSGDPLGAGVIPLPQLLGLLFQYAGGTVQLSCKFFCDPLFRQQDRTVIGKRFHAPGKRPQGPVETITEPERESEDQDRVQDEEDGNVLGYGV